MNSDQNNKYDSDENRIKIQTRQLRYNEPEYVLG